MIQKPKNLIYLFFLILHSFGVFGQSYPFINYSVESGLSQGQILSIYQAKDGVMWFGTTGGGITKYDGHFYEYVTDKDGLADNVVFSIVEDSKGRLLIGTNNGLSIYDPSKKQKFKNYTTQDGLSDNRIFNISLDDNDNAYLATSKGVTLFKENKCVALKINKKLDTANVFRVLIDGDDLWFSTLGSGAFHYDGKKTINYTTKQGLENDMIFAIYRFDKNSIWFLSGEGLFELKNQSITKLPDFGVNKAATFYNYFLDNKNTLWLGTNEGAIKINKDLTFKVFTSTNGLTDNSIWEIYQDHESNLWFASDQNGISKLASEKFYIHTTKDGLVYDEIKRLFYNSKNECLIGTREGFSVFKNNIYKNYKHKALEGTSNIWSLSEDKNGNYLIGTSSGLIVFDGENAKRITCKDKTSLMNTIFDILFDDKEQIWLATQIGVAKLVDGYIQPFTDFPVSTNFINKIVQDAPNNYWFCTDDGLFQYNAKSIKQFSEKDGFTTKRVRDVIKDKQNNYWIATSVGLFKLNGSKFTNITKPLKLSSDDVYAIALDSTGNLWAGLASGIAKVELSNNDKITQYDVADGFIGQVCSQNAMVVSPEGKLIIGTEKGLMFYQSQFDKPNNLEPMLKIKNIDLFFQEADWTNYSDSVNSNNIPYNLILPYDKNYLSFNFIGVSLTTPEKVTYKYMLNGIDKDWRVSTKNDASYSNIPPGNYELIVYSHNGNGIWNKTPVSFKFIINPPFWRTWWFYSIIIFIILIAIYSYIKIRTANVKILKQNEIIEEKNNAIQHAYKEIAEINKDITASINYARRIQRSFLTSNKVLGKLLDDYFVLFKPRDIVSGDFYLAFDLPDRTVVVCADCTGHGIPGAFMSLIGISILNEISRSSTNFNSASMLEEIRKIIIESLNPEKLESGGKDGMDISLISIFKTFENGKVNIEFAGANNSIHIVSNETGEIIRTEYKGDKQPVGFYSHMKPFTLKNIQANKGDYLYMFTDGYADQFGGESGKKFMSKQLKNLLESIYPMSLDDQKQQLNASFAKWKGNLEQVDDVTVIGIKL